MNTEMIKKVVRREANGEYKVLGTCFFVDTNIAVTARHVVKNKENVYIEMSDKSRIEVSYKCHDSYDFAILKTSEPIYKKDFYELNGTMIFEREKWQSFGFPTTREINGENLEGIVSIPETIEEFLYDIDLKMIPDGGLSNYEGMSGAPVIIDNTIQAILIKKTDGISLGGVKIEKCLDFLEKNGVKFKRDYSYWIEKLKRKKDVNNSKIDLERKCVINKLERFALNGSGLVVGKAGTGKSYMLKMLENHLNKKEIPVIYLAIDEFDNVSDVEFSKELKLDENESFTDRLAKEIKRLRLKDKKIIIIFDSYDSARNEKVKDRFMKIIIRIKEELSDYCNVIVSSRIYDAEISPKLQAIFPYENIEKGKSNTKIQCRHIIIGELDDEEVIEALQQIGINEDMYERCAYNFKQLLKVPFNLWLIESIFKNNLEVREFQSINSETELLDMFWDKRLNGTKKDSLEAILRIITEKLVINKALTIRKSDFFTSNMQSEWSILLSESIIRYVDAFEKKIAFSHNILFDYAVNKVLLTDKIDEFIEFIEEDTSRIIFLRPSLMYFFNSIWYYENSYFWNIIFDITVSNKIPVIAKFLPIHTIITEIQSINDLDILIDRWNKNHSEAEEIVKRLLQALDIFNVLDNNLWVQFIARISSDIKENFIGILSYNINKIVDISLLKENESNFEVCGDIGRKFYLWIVQNNKINNTWFREISSKFLVPIICKTYSTDGNKSNVIIKEIVDNIDTNGKNIDFLSSVSRHIKYIYQSDTEFTEYIYSRVYSQRVTSIQTTIMGGAPVLPLLSNKKQDFEMCKYNLQREIENLIIIDSKNGIKIALRTLKTIIENDELSTRDNSLVVYFHNRNITIIEDNSHWWVSSHISEDIGGYSNAIFDYLNNISIKADETLLDEFFDVFVDEAKNAYLWGQLLVNAAKNAGIFKNRLFDLCVSHEIMKSNDLIYQLGVFIKSCNFQFNKMQLLKIEEAINSLNDTKGIEKVKKRLIMCIDESLLSLSESIKLIKDIEKEDKVYDNKPLVKLEVTELKETYLEKLRRRGILISESEDIFLVLDRLNYLNNKVVSRRATTVEVDTIFKSSVRLYKIIQCTELQYELEKEVWYELCKGIDNSVRGADEQYIKNNYKIYKEILIKVVKLDMFNEQDRNFEGIYRSYIQTPKHLAAKLLPVLIEYQDDEDIISAIELLLKHPSSSLRCVLIQNLYRIYDHEERYMWEKLNDIVMEADVNIFAAVVHCLRELVNTNNEKTGEVLNKVCSQGKDNIKFINEANDIILYLNFFPAQEWTKEIVTNITKNPYSYKWIGLDGISSTIFEWIKYDSLSNLRDSSIKAIMSFIDNTVYNLQNEIEILNEKLSEDNKDELLTEQFKNVYDVFDLILNNLYFKCGAMRDEKQQRDKNLEQKYFFTVSPIINKVAEWVDREHYALILAPTIHHIIEMLNYLLEFDVCNIIKLIKIFILYSRKVGYTGDSLAEKEMVDIMKKIFADYKLKIQDEEVLKNIMIILDCFAEIGSSDAVNFIWHLEEIYR